VVIPVAIVLLAGRRLAPIAAGAATAIGFHLALWLPWGIADVWDQSYGYHLEVAGERTPGANLLKVFSTMGDRDAIILIAAALALAAVLLRRQAAPPTPDGRPGLAPDLLLGTWVGASLLVLLTEHPMWRPHVSQLVPGLALLAARHRPSWRVLAVAGVVLLPYHLIHGSEVLWPEPYEGFEAEAVDLMRDLPDGALAISDEPGLVWRAGRRTTPDLVDASVLRVQTRDITGESLAQAADRPDVCAVVVTSGARWGSFDELPLRLAAAGFEVATEAGDVRRVYVKPEPACDP
ncbi:MAG: hypothetical protein ABWZ52_02280, partial [Acidimicrobiales bacterium]